MSGPKRERDPICDVCGHCHVQGVKCTICGHVGKYIGAARTRAQTHRMQPHLHPHPHTSLQHAERCLCRAVPGGPNRPNRGSIPPVPPGPVHNPNPNPNPIPNPNPNPNPSPSPSPTLNQVHNPNRTPPTIEGITVAEFQRVRCRTSPAAAYARPCR